MDSMRLPRLKFTVTALAAALCVTAASHVTLAAENKAKTSPKIKTPAPVFSDARLKAFAAASTKILEIRKKYLPQLQAAGSEEDIRKISEAGQNEMMQAIAAHGLTSKQYNDVVAAVQKDRSLIERIENIEKRMKKAN